MKIRRAILPALMLVLLTVENAAANVSPAPDISLMPVALVFLLILLSLAGGAYPILGRLHPNRNRWWRIALRWLCVLLLPLDVLFRILDAFPPLALGAVILSLLSLSFYRSVQMLRWGYQARAAASKPHLATAKPWRLLAAGALLIALPVILVFAMGTVKKEPSGVLRTLSDAKTAVTQSLVYAHDTGRYPTGMHVLRQRGYVNISDTDPWQQPWVFAPPLLEGREPRPDEEVYIYSKGPCGTGTYEPTRWRGTPSNWDTGKCGPLGYSSVHGSFRGRY